jgi:hypothetical protein
MAVALISRASLAGHNPRQTFHLSMPKHCSNSPHVERAAGVPESVPDLRGDSATAPRSTS